MPQILRNLQLTFVLCSASQKWGEDFAKVCGLLRIYELYHKKSVAEEKKFCKNIEFPCAKNWCAHAHCIWLNRV